MTKTTKSSKLVATVCFYGNREIGFAYLAETEALRGANGFGTYTREVMDGSKKMPHSTLTAGLFAALDEICSKLGRGARGKVRIFAPHNSGTDGDSMTYADIDHNFPHAWGDIGSPMLAADGVTTGWVRS